MSQGDAQASDNSILRSTDGGAAQQSAMAGARMSTETHFMPVPVGHMTMAEGFPDTAFANPAAVGAETPGQKLDKTKSVGQLMSAGVFKPLDAPSGAPRPAEATVQTLKPGESPQVTVTYKNDGGVNQKAPDFIVKQDGTIQAAGTDPSAINKKDVVIQVEAPANHPASPGADQQKSIDGLVTYLKDRYSAENPAVAQNGLNLIDDAQLITPDTAKLVGSTATSADAAATTAAARQNFAPQTQGAMSQGSRFAPGSSGSLSRGDVNQYVPERSQPLAKDETQTVADMKNAIAGEFKPDAASKANPNAPYETSRMDRVGTNEMPVVGRYGMNYNIIRGWFGSNFGGDDDFDDDSIVGKMDALAKSGKVSKAFAAKFHNKEFAHKFVHAMHEMKAGHMMSKADMKELMPAQLQEQIAADTVGKFAQAAGGDTGKVALAFHLGKSPDQLSAAELADKGNQEYEQTARTFGQLSHARTTMGSDPNGKYDYTVADNGTLMDQKLRQAAMSTAASMGGPHSQGLCATGAQIALQKVGQGEFMGSGNGYAMHHQFDRDPNWRLVDSATFDRALQKGHVGYVCRQWANDPNGAGHVELVGLNSNGVKMGYSDFAGQHRDTNSYYNYRNDRHYLPVQDLQDA